MYCSSRPIIPLQHNYFNYLNKPRDVSQSSARDLENEVITLRKENMNLRIRLSPRKEENLFKHKNIESLTKKLEDATNTIEKLHHIVDEKTELLKETAVAIENHEKYQRSQEKESRTKIKHMESYIRQLEENVNKLNQGCLTKDVGNQAELDPDLLPLTAEPLSKQQLRTHESDLTRHDVELHNQNIHGKPDLNKHADANRPRNGVTNGDKKDSGIQTDNFMDSISCLLLEVREEMKQNKSVNRAQKIAMLDVEQTQDTTFNYLMDKISKLSERVRVLEKSVL